MGSLERRLEALEEHIRPAERRSQDTAERERRRAAFLEIVEGISEKADAEAAEGNSARRRALDQLLESMRRRASMRRQARES